MPPGAPAYVPLVLPTAYRRYTREEGSIPFASGKSSNPLRIDQSGTLLSLMLSFTGTVAVLAGNPQPALHPEAPWSLMKRVTISGGGIGKNIAIPGAALRVFEQVRESDFVPTAPNFVPAAGGGGGVTTAVSFDVVAPICVRDGDLVGEWSDYLGAIYTGDQNLQLRVQIDWATESDVFTNQSSALAVIAGAVTVTSFKLDTPAPSQDASLLAAISWSHQLIAEQENVSIGGAGSLAALDDLPTAQPRAYLRVLDQLRNGSPVNVPLNGLIATMNAELQDTVDFERDVLEQVWLARQQRRYQVPLPVGNYVLDFSAGNRRDNWLPVGSLTLFRWRPTITVPGGVTLANANYNRYSEVVVPSPLAATWMQQAPAPVLAAAMGASPVAA